MKSKTKHLFVMWKDAYQFKKFCFETSLKQFRYKEIDRQMNNR